MAGGHPSQLPAGTSPGAEYCRSGCGGAAGPAGERRAPFSLDVQFMIIGGTEDAKWLSEKYHLSTFVLDVPPLSSAGRMYLRCLCKRRRSRKNSLPKAKDGC